MKPVLTNSRCTGLELSSDAVIVAIVVRPGCRLRYGLLGVPLPVAAGGRSSSTSPLAWYCVGTSLAPWKSPPVTAIPQIITTYQRRTRTASASVKYTALTSTSGRGRRRDRDPAFADARVPRLVARPQGVERDCPAAEPGGWQPVDGDPGEQPDVGLVDPDHGVVTEHTGRAEPGQVVDGQVGAQQRPRGLGAEVREQLDGAVHGGELERLTATRQLERVTGDGGEGTGAVDVDDPEALTRQEDHVVHVEADVGQDRPAGPGPLAGPTGRQGLDQRATAPPVATDDRRRPQPPRLRADD